ncbi:Serine/threonine-protein kinase [Dinochytrium kinnereticum]|nr:Serine/threonine-protein kinase [Dinochytrium kinnereticum]
MGNVVTAAYTAADPRLTKGIDSYVGELPDVSYEKSLGSARFMKTIRCKHREGSLVVKLFVKPDPSVSLKQVVKELLVEREVLKTIPNALPYTKIFETERAGYMVRQFIYCNLYDRISTRPFLSSIEKKWITFQLLMGVANAHAEGIYHGDLKTENVLVTSWNWVYIIDFSAYKPLYLPEDNPADYAYFFDTSSRRTCYVAPERFLAPGETLFSEKGGKLTPAMDIFSLGSLLRYRSGEHNPMSDLEKIDDDAVRNMIKNMIQVDPSARKSARQFLDEGRGTLFPEYFYTFLHSYLATLIDPTAATLLSSHQLSLPDGLRSIYADADWRIERIHRDFARISAALSMSSAGETGSPAVPEPESSWAECLKSNKNPTRGDAIFPVRFSIPGYMESSANIMRTPAAELRSTLFPSSRLMALDMLLALGLHLPDEYRLDRIVPYLITMIPDEMSLVRATALRALTQLLSMTDSVTPSDANIFPEFILPSLHRLSTDHDVFVRTTYALCVSSLAESALKLLELSQMFKQGPLDVEGDTDMYLVTYDAALRDLHELVQDEVIALLIDAHPAVKRALLSEMPRLCIFFGRQRANDVLLGHMITYLNDLDWQLRSSFFESIVGVGTFVGSRSLEEYILPLTLQALTDSEEFVVEKSDIPQITEIALIDNVKSPISRYLYDQTLALASKSPSVSYREERRLSEGHGHFEGRAEGESDLLVKLRELGMTDEDKEKLIAMKYYISKSSQSRMRRESQDNHRFQSEDFDIKNLGITPRTVFLTPPKYDSEPSEPPIASSRSRVSSVQSTSSIYSRLTRVTSETNLRPPSPGLSTQQQRLRDHGPPSAPGSGLTTPHRIYGHHKSLSDASVFSDFTQDIKPAVPPGATGTTPSTDPTKFLNSLTPSSPIFTSSSSVSTSGLSAQQRPISAVSDSGLMGSGNRQSQDLSDRASVFSMDRLSLDMVKGKQSVTATIAVSSETAMATIDTRISSSLPKSSLGSPSPIASQLRQQPLSGSSSSVAAAVVAAASVGNQRAFERGHGRRESLVSIASQGSNFGVGAEVAEGKPMAAPTSPALSVGMPVLLEDAVGNNPSLAALGPEGRDRNIQKILESKRLELFPPPLVELGAKVSAPLVASGVAQRGRRPRTAVAATGNDLKNWKPEGILAAHLTEHHGQINQIQLAPDHNFFATCSDDGTVKIWDSQRLERQVTNRARLTYGQQGGKILSIAFCENTHSLASASDNGTIHISRVEYLGASSANGAPKYNGTHVVRTSNVSGMDERDYAVALHHYDSEVESILTYATSHGKICGLDLRSMKLAWSFDSPPQHGSISSFTMDRRHSWILSGTHRGVMTLWDIRFGLRVKSWAHPSRSKIHKLSGIGTGVAGMMMQHASGGRGAASIPSSGNSSFSASMITAASKMVLAAVGNRTGEVSLWDLEASECKEVWCVFGGGGSVASGAGSGAGGRGVPDPSAEMDRLYGNGLRPVDPLGLSDFLNISQLGTSQPVASETSVRSFVNPLDAPFLLTAGSDRRIRFWDLADVSNSYVVSGMEMYETSPKYSSHQYGDISFNIEYTPSHAFSSSITSPTKTTPVQQSSSAAPSTSPSATVHSGAALSATPSVMNHLDAINDLVVTQVPYPMIISGGRDGVVKVWI